MPNTKFSAITLASSAPSLTDTLIGVGGGTTDLQYTFGDVASFIGLIPASSSKTWYVATTGSDSNPGTIGSPFLTIQHAANVIAGYNYLNLYVPTIQVADGTYSNVNVVLPALIGCPSPAIVVGNLVTPTNVVLNDGGTYFTFSLTAYSNWAIGGFKFSGTYGGIGTLIFSSCNIGGPLVFSGTLPHGCLSPSQGFLNGFGASLTVTGPTSGPLLTTGLTCNLDFSTINFSGAVTFTGPVIAIDDRLGFVGVSGCAFTGATNVTMTSGQPCLEITNGAYFQTAGSCTVDGSQMSRTNFPGHATGPVLIDSYSTFDVDQGIVGEANFGYYWTNANDGTGTRDTGFSRSSPGIVALGNGTQGNGTGSLILARVNGARVSLDDISDNLGTSVAFGSVTNLFGQNVAVQGWFNTALGALVMNGVMTSAAVFNTGVGVGVMNGLTSGASNTGVGGAALIGITTGSGNTGVGTGTNAGVSTKGALGSVLSGTNNTAIGFNSGNAITTGSNNTIIGSYAGTTTLSGAIALSDGAANLRLDYGATTASTWSMHGPLAMLGSSSGAVTIAAAAAAGTYNFNLPITPGSVGDVLTSQGGGGTAMTWTTLSTSPLATSNLTWFVATTGNDSNPGTVGSPFLTIQHAVDVASQFNWNFLWFPTINVANGTYTQQLTLNQLFNCPNGGVIVGNVASQNSVVIADTGTDYAIQVSTGNWTVSGLKTTGTFGGLQTSGTLSVDHISIGGNLAHECIAVDYGAAFNFFGESITIVATNANGGLCFSRGFFGADGSNVTFANAVTFGDSANSTMSGDANLAFYACDAFTFTNGSNVTMNSGSNAALSLFNGAFFEMDSNTKVDGVQLTRANFPGGTTTQNVDPFSVFQGDNLASRVFSDLTIDEAPFSTTASNNAILNLNGRLSGTLNQARIFADFNGSLNLQPANGLLILDNVGVLSIDPGVGSANAILNLTARLGGVAAPEVQVLADELGTLHLITQVGGGQDISLEADSETVSFDGSLEDSSGLTAFGNAFGGYLSGVKFGAAANILWSSTGNWFDTVDTGISRNAAGIIEINNGTPGTFADLKARSLGAIAGTITANITNVISQTWNNGATDFSPFEINITNTAFGVNSQTFNINVGGTDIFNIDSGGFVLFNGGFGSTDNSIGADSALDSGSVAFFALNSTGLAGWTATANWFTGPDTALGRTSAGVLEVNTGVAGTLAQLKGKTLKVSNTGHAGLLLSSGGTNNGTVANVDSTHWALGWTVDDSAITGTALTWSDAGLVSVTHGATILGGTTTVAPLTLTSGTNLTTATAGAFEFDGKAFYQTSVASSRQVSVTEQVQILSGTRTFANNTSAQAIFNATTNGAITLAATTTYEFEMYVAASGFSASAHSVSLGFGGTATLTSIGYFYDGQAGSTLAGPNATVSGFIATATATALVAAGTTTTGLLMKVRGTVRVNAGGTFIPQLTQGTASAAAVVQANSFFRCWPIGSNTVTNVGNWS